MNTLGFIDLRISGSNLCNEEISSKLTLPSMRFNKKGDVYWDKYTHKKIAYTEDSWYAGIKLNENESAESSLDRFVDTIYPHASYLKELSLSFDITLWLSLYPDNEQMNVHLSTNLIEKISKMGISIDISTVFLGKIFEGEY